MLCEICSKTTHVTSACVWPSQPKPVVQLLGFATKGLGCFYAQNTKKNSGGRTNVMALISIKRETPTCSGRRVEEIFSRGMGLQG
jgi:hypothetical protein